MIDRGEPAIMVCHWPGIYFNGEEVGFQHLPGSRSARLHARYDNLIWMKLSEIARYWAARELTQISRQGNRIVLDAPFASPRFTLRLKTQTPQPPRLSTNGATSVLAETQDPASLRSGAWHRRGDDLTICFDLPKGRSVAEV